VVGDDPVPAGDGGEPGGEVDRRAVDVPSRVITVARREAHPDVRQRGVGADLLHDVRRDVDGRLGEPATNRTESPSVLITRRRMR
jgi:hypothetical protein